jgi:hypothetical protein
MISKCQGPHLSSIYGWHSISNTCVESFLLRGGHEGRMPAICGIGGCQKPTLKLDHGHRSPTSRRGSFRESAAGQRTAGMRSIADQQLFWPSGHS